MRPDARKRALLSVLGPLAALSALFCAPALADWQDQMSLNGPHVEGASRTPSPWPATEVARPLNTSPQAAGRPIGSGTDPAVVRAGYETPADANPAGRTKELGPRSPADGTERTHLLPRSKPSSPGGAPSGPAVIWTTGGALALVLGLFYVVVWLMRRAAPKTASPLPADVVEILGRAPLGGRQCVHLIRCGRKLLLVNVTAERADTLTEITDPVEVDRLAGLCEQSRSGTATAAFRHVFEQFSQPGRRRGTLKDEIPAGSYFDDDRRSVLEGHDV
jgi:flagellar biogenesis protein FliO